MTKMKKITHIKDSGGREKVWFKADGYRRYVCMSRLEARIKMIRLFESNDYICCYRVGRKLRQATGSLPSIPVNDLNKFTCMKMAKMPRVFYKGVGESGYQRISRSQAAKKLNKFRSGKYEFSFCLPGDRWQTTSEVDKRIAASFTTMVVRRKTNNNNNFEVGKTILDYLVVAVILIVVLFVVCAISSMIYVFSSWARLSEGRPTITTIPKLAKLS